MTNTNLIKGVKFLTEDGINEVTKTQDGGARELESFDGTVCSHLDEIIYAILHEDEHGASVETAIGDTEYCIGELSKLLDELKKVR